MELIDSGLSQKIMDRHANVPLFTTHFSPVLSTKRIIPRTRWLELVYALPFYMILRRTKNVFATAKRIGNMFVHYTKQDSSLPSGRSGFFVALFGYYSSTPLLFLSQKIAPVKPPGVSLVPHYLSATKPEEMSKSRPASVFAISAVDNYTIPRPYGRLERETITYVKSSSPPGLAQPVHDEASGMGTEAYSAVANYPVPAVSTLPLTVSHKPTVVHYKTQAAYAPPQSTGDSFAALFSYYSHNPLLFLSQKTAPVKPQGVSLVPHYLSATKPEEMSKSRPASVFAISAVDNYTIPRPYGRLERETITYVKSSSPPGLAQPVHDEASGMGTEAYSAVANYPVPAVSTLPPTVSHKPSAVLYKSLVPHYRSTTEPTDSGFAISADYTIPQNVPYRLYGRLERESYILRSTNDFINFSSLNSMNDNQRQHTPEMEKAASIYHTHPEIEHVTTTRTELIKEREIEKEAESKSPHAAPQLPGIDVNRLTDQIYQMMERKIRIEKERRGLYG